MKYVVSLVLVGSLSINIVLILLVSAISNASSLWKAVFFPKLNISSGVCGLTSVGGVIFY